MTIEEKVRAEIGDKLFWKKWTGGRAVMRINDDLILAIPPEYQTFWTWSDPPPDIERFLHDPKFLQALPVVLSAGFDMHLPAYSGYTAENYLRTFDANRVNVVSISGVSGDAFVPGASGSYPPNMWARTRGMLNLKNYEEMYGLRCYGGGVGGNDRICYGAHPGISGGYILMDVDLPPYEPYIAFPMMRVKYSDKRHGGIEVVWRSHASNFSRWKEIDGKIFEYIDTWNIALKR